MSLAEGLFTVFFGIAVVGFLIFLASGCSNTE